MDARAFPHPALPDMLQRKMQALTHDLALVKQHVRAGHLPPEKEAAVERILQARLFEIQAEVQARLLHESRLSQLPRGFRLN